MSARTLPRILVFFALTCLLATAPMADACTRVTWLGPEGAVITGRSMDWPYSFNAHLYAIPEGLSQNGSGGINSLTWTSKYGAVVVAGNSSPGGPIDAVFDGMNEAGLVANLLYLSEADFGPAPTDNRPRLSFAGWVQYVLTSFSTVNEVVDAFSNPSIYIVPIEFGPDGMGKPTVHLAVSDAGGDSAIFEYLDGKVTVHHGRQYQVMTNSPTFDEQLALAAQWKDRDPTTQLPGSVRSEDRFVRASYYLSQLPQTTDNRQAIAGVLSVIRNVSAPWGVADPEHPNIAPTYWRSVADLTNKVYYFESTLSPNIVWANLRELNLAPGSGVRAVAVENDNDTNIGNIDAKFAPAAPITFLAP